MRLRRPDKYPEELGLYRWPALFAVGNVIWRAPDVIFETGGATAVRVAVIDGPYDATALSGILAQAPVNLGDGGCGVNPNSACSHGTFVMGILGARRDASIPGICPGCRLLHVPLFGDEAQWASVAELANAISVAVTAGARLLNLSLAVLGDDAENHSELALALDRAEASGAVVVVAAGNQSRLAIGQLLSHPATVPVVAVDSAGGLLPGCNFGPLISRRGVAAIGHEVLGYAPGGRTAVMSGTSVATAVATGTLALLWSERPDAEGAEIRAAVARLGSRNGPIPPMLDRNSFLAALDRRDAAAIAAALPADRGKANYASLQGETAMNIGNGLPRSLSRGSGPPAMSGQAVTPAQGLGGCTCGAPGGVCTCADGPAPSSFIYVLGTVDIRFPDQSISGELQTVARTMNIVQGTEEDLRIWCHRVLSLPEARHVARLVSWILTVEGLPAYYLALRDLHDLSDLISCLAEPKDDDLCLFIGSSSLVPVETCPGVAVPVLAVDQLSMFKRERLTPWCKTPPKPLGKKVGPSPSEPSLEASGPNDLFDRLVQSADNLGDTDEWRALNYLAVCYQPLYERHAQMLHDDYILDSIKVMKSRLSREKRIVDPVFAFRNKQTGIVRKFFVRLDVSYLYPMIVTKLTEYFDR